MDDSQPTQEDIDAKEATMIDAHIALNEVDHNDPKAVQKIKTAADQAIIDHDKAVTNFVQARTATFNILTVQQAQYLGINPDNFDNENTLKEAVDLRSNNQIEPAVAQAQLDDANRAIANQQQMSDMVNSNQEPPQ